MDGRAHVSRFASIVEQRNMRAMAKPFAMEIVAVADRTATAAVPEIAAIRLISLLPPDWRGESMPSENGFVLCITVPECDRWKAHTVIARAFSNRQLRDWVWTDCTEQAGPGASPGTCAEP
jgi:hypothetical protein